ncbi:hypothetical protein ambt_16215 [Alteromonas naphthalenivorans]|uniref:Uncharacterized protein n=1 Tax=Alteromonas naphthalenivorans TaxID=715451 RepID=F5Z5A4_ALTNA|nr:hypothetical protein ambt_16215 [Alteromonas naphthalenivorans]
MVSSVFPIYEAMHVLKGEVYRKLAVENSADCIR